MQNKRLTINQAMNAARERFTRSCLLKWALNESSLGYTLGSKADLTTEKLHYFEIKLINHN